MIIDSIDDLTNSYGYVSMGIKPSGKLHLGTAMTVLSSIAAVKPGGTVDIRIMDLDFDHQRGPVFTPFFWRADEDGCHDYMKQHALEEVRDLSHVLSASAGISANIKVDYFSAITWDTAFMVLMSDLFLEPPGRMLLSRNISHSGSGKPGHYLSPMCPCCNTSTSTPGTLNSVGELTVGCLSKTCSVVTYMESMFTPERVSFFYLVDPVRDVLSGADIHVFGGDYGVPYGKSGVSKAMRVAGLIADFAGKSPDIYVGPLVQVDGEKMAKSSSSGFLIEDVNRAYPDWVERLNYMRADKVADVAKYFPKCLLNTHAVYE